MPASWLHSTPSYRDGFVNVIICVVTDKFHNFRRDGLMFFPWMEESGSYNRPEVEAHSGDLGCVLKFR